MEPNASSSDSLASGLSWMLVINVMQRGIGFVRNLALCYFLSESQLGLWGLASGFFCLAAPLAVLGLPGTFGRFVETYRLSGQLPRFLLFSAILSLVGYVALSLSLLMLGEASSVTIFGEARSTTDMLFVLTALGCIIVFNGTTELISGLRLPKTVSWMHAVNSLSFTLFALTGLIWYQDWRILVVASCASALMGMVPSIPVLRRLRDWEGQSLSRQHSIRWKEIAGRVLPFAASVWIINLLVNSFDIVDRYLLLHFSTSETRGQDIHALLGQLHSGKLIPTLLSNLAVMLAGIVLPYLVADWEQSRRERVASSLKTTVKFGSLFFFLLSLGALVVSPFLFGWLLQGRYADGLAIMPKALTVCCWMSISLFLGNYFWCAERGRLLGVLTSAALAIDILLCIWWIPSMGLHGAMNANMTASGILLVLTFITLFRLNVALDGSTLLVAMAPLVLVFGPLPAAGAMATISILASRTSWILTKDEKLVLDAAVAPHLRRIGWHIASIWAR